MSGFESARSPDEMKQMLGNALRDPSKNPGLSSDNTGITLCNSLKVSPWPPRTEAQEEAVTCL